MRVGSSVQTDPTLLRYALAIMEQKKYWELLASKLEMVEHLMFNHFKLCATTPNNTQKQAATCNTGCPNGCNMYSNLQKCSICLHGGLDDNVVLTVKTDYIIRVSMDVDPHWPLRPVQGQMG